MARGRDFLGTFRLVRLIRAGQTCQVWEAINDIDGRRVALKALQPEVRDSREEMAYLRHEYEVAKDFDHPNVIHVYEFSTDRDTPFLVIEFSNSRNLKLALRAGHEALDHLAPTIIEKAAAGLKYMHEQGWIHCDVKPDNFLLAEDGDIKLIDFAIAQKKRTGLARLLAGGAKVVQGTRSYMAPEQIRGKSLDQRADIYSFGCTVYELLTGRTPYTGTTPQELLSKHVRAPVPSVLVGNNNVTPEFGALVAQMMAKSPDERPGSMQGVLQSVRTVRLFRTRPKPPEPASEEAAEGE